MEITLKRIAKKALYTIGQLFINNAYFCDTLEDTDRNVSNDMTTAQIASIKVKGQTAIPRGRYSVVITQSARFNCPLPLLLNVKAFDGIRIHSGNTHNDTQGCILVGQNKEVGKVINSRQTFNRLFALIQKTQQNKEPIFITIV